MKKSSAKKHSLKEISELLDSDDELADSYNEVPATPAYQDDNRFERFEPIKFDWHLEKLSEVNTLVHTKQQDFQRSEQESELCDTNKVLPEQTTNIKESQKKILISKGIMTKQDIFFIKSIEEYSTDTTLLWFIDFLNCKAVKPWQRSCLVQDITEKHHYNAGAKIDCSDFKLRYYLKLVVQS